MRQHQQGFSLVELMVAMAIGSIIILGAGQLFLTTFQTFKAVDEISRKQEALIFAVSTLTKEGRRGNIINYAITSDERSFESGNRYYCVLQDELQNQPIVDLAQVDNASDCPVLHEANNDDVSHTLTLLIGDCRKSADAGCDEFTFAVSERDKAMTTLKASP